MKTYDLKASLRTTRGNGPARAMRREGQIPAVLYGPGADPTTLTVSRKEVTDILRRAGSRQVMFKLDIEGRSDQPTAMIKELQADVVSQRPLHADFYQIDMNREISVMIPVVTTGACKGVEMGGLLQVVRRELEIICLPGDMMNEIVIDVTDLGVGDSLHLSEIDKPDAVRFPDSVDFTVLTVVAPTTVAEEEEEGEEGEEGAEASEDSETGEKADEPAE